MCGLRAEGQASSHTAVLRPQTRARPVSRWGVRLLGPLRSCGQPLPAGAGGGPELVLLLVVMKPEWPAAWTAGRGLRGHRHAVLVGGDIFSGHVAVL